MTGAMQKFLPDSFTDKVMLIFAGFLFLFVVYAFFLISPENAIQQDGKPLGKLITSGKVQRRHAGSLHWTTLSDSGTIYLRDTVYTPKGTTAELLWENKRLKLEPESMVQFDEITLERIRTVLLEGNQAKALTSYDILPKKEEAVRILPYPKITRTPTLVSDLAIQEKYLEPLNQRLLQVLGRTISFAPVFPVARHSFTLDRLSDYQVKLLEPTNQNYNLAANPWMKMRWLPIPINFLQYELQIAKDPKFRSMIRHATKKTELSVQLKEAGTYYWRVRAVRGRESLVSFTHEFSMQYKGGVVAAPQRQVGSIVAPLPYRWEIATNPNFVKPVRTSLSKSQWCSYGGLMKGNYYCRVRNAASNKLVIQYQFSVRK
jgi:hypothetical protein